METVPVETDQKQDWLDQMRQMLAFLEEHPDLIPEYSGVDIYFYATDAEEFATLARQLGAAEKVPSGEYAGLNKDFGQHTLRLYTNREQVCERVQTGVQTVERQVPVTFETEVIEEPVYEWRCTDSWLEVPA